MAEVTGIGGFFFRARDPEALNRWYGEQLGVVMFDSHGYEDPGWSSVSRRHLRDGEGARDSEPIKTSAAADWVTAARPRGRAAALGGRRC